MKSSDPLRHWLPAKTKASSRNGLPAQFLFVDARHHTDIHSTHQADALVDQSPDSLGALLVSEKRTNFASVPIISDAKWTIARVRMGKWVLPWALASYVFTGL